MKTTPWISAALLIAVSAGAPALAQMSSGSMQPGATPPSGTMQPQPMQPGSMPQSNAMQPNSMPSGSMPSDTQNNGMSPSAPAMSASDMKKMKACQAMSPDAMMKNARCAKLMKMHPDMMPGSPNGG